MASAPTVTSPADNSSQTVPFTLSGTSDGTMVEIRDDAGLLVPASANPVAVSGGAFSTQIQGLTGNKGCAFGALGGTIATAVTLIDHGDGRKIHFANSDGAGTISLTVPSIPANSEVFAIVYGGGSGESGGASGPLPSFDSLKPKETAGTTRATFVVKWHIEMNEPKKAGDEANASKGGGA